MTMGAHVFASTGKVQKEENNKFLETNEDHIMQQLEEEPFKLAFGETNEENDKDYEEVNERNAMFYKEQAGNTSPYRKGAGSANKINFNDIKGSQGTFYDRVDNITKIILDNLQNTKLSKKQFLQLIISNILKNEQEEIK